MEFRKPLGEMPLGEAVNRMRAADSIQFERFSINPGTGYLSTFAYISASDHKYLLEVAYTQSDLSAFVSELKPVNITSRLTKSNPDIVSVEFLISSEES